MFSKLEQRATLHLRKSQKSISRKPKGLLNDIICNTEGVSNLSNESAPDYFYYRFYICIFILWIVRIRLQLKSFPVYS